MIIVTIIWQCGACNSIQGYCYHLLAAHIIVDEL